MLRHIGVVEILACGHVARAGTSRTCRHLAGAAESDYVEYVRLLTGRGLDADLCCTDCDKAGQEGGPVTLVEVCEGCVARYDDDFGSFTGWRGVPEIVERPEPVDPALAATPLPAGLGQVIDLAAVPTADWNVPMCWVGDDLLAVSGIGTDAIAMLPGVRLFDVATGVELHTFAGPRGDLFGAGRRLYAAAPDGLEIWNPLYRSSHRTDPRLRAHPPPSRRRGTRRAPRQQPGPLAHLSAVDPRVGRGRIVWRRRGAAVAWRPADRRRRERSMTAVQESGADRTMAEIGHAVERGRGGDRAGARAALELLWDRLGPAGDAVHRCSIAHYAADLQESVEDELRWDQRALATVTDPGDERMRGFLPTLHLNLADAYRRCGDAGRAQHHLSAADTFADVLPADDYGAMIRGGVAKVRAALSAGSKAALPT